VERNGSSKPTAISLLKKSRSEAEQLHSAHCLSPTYVVFFSLTLAFKRRRRRRRRGKKKKKEKKKKKKKEEEEEEEEEDEEVVVLSVL